MSPTVLSSSSTPRPSTPLPPPPLAPPTPPRGSNSPPPPPTGRAAFRPPPPPASPPPGPRRRIPDVSAWPLASWLSLLGSALVAAAALVVGFAGRETLGAFGPAAGLAGAAAATWFAGRRMRRPAPIVARVLDHLARLETAVGATAVVGALAPWPIVVAAFGIALGATSWRWRLGGTWGASVVRVAAIGSGLTATAAETWIPLGVLLGLAAVVATGVVFAMRSRGQVFDPVAVLLATAAFAAPLGGWPGAVRVGPGTLARLGLRGDLLSWAAPTAGILAAVALMAWSRRHRSRTAAYGALAGLGANVLIGIGYAELTQWTQAIWIATMFAGIQAVARTTSSDDFFDDTIGAVGRTLARWGLPALGIMQLGVVAEIVRDGRSTTAAVVPLLIGVGYVLAPPVPPNGLTSIAAGASAVVTVYAATGSVTLVAAVAAIALIVVVVADGRESTTNGPVFAAAALGAWILTVVTQVVDAGLPADGLAIIVLATTGVGTGRRARLEATLLVIAGAAVSAHAASWAGGSVPRYTAAILAAGVAGLALFVSRRAGASVSAAAVLALALPAFGRVVGPNPALPTTVPAPLLAAPATQVALASLFVGVIGASAWFRHTWWAGHLVAGATVMTATTAAVAVGAPREWVVGVGVLVGIAVAGGSFIRSTFGPGDTAALATTVLAFAIGVGQPAASSAFTLSWLASIVFGVLVMLHGLCRLDAVLAALGAVVAGVSAFVLVVITDTPARLFDAARAVGMSSADVNVALLVVGLAAAGAAVARFTPSTNSWHTFGPAASLASAHLLVTIAVADHADVRVLIALTFSVASIAVGALGRRAAPLVLGSVTVVGAVLLASWATLVALPTWVWMAVGGASLLALAAVVERRSRRDQAA